MTSINELLDELEDQIKIFPEEMEKCVDPETIAEFNQQLEVLEQQEQTPDILANIDKLEQQINVYMDTITHCIERRTRAEQADAVANFEERRLAEREAAEQARIAREEQEEIQRQQNSEARLKAIQETEHEQNLKKSAPYRYTWKLIEEGKYIALIDVNIDTLLTYSYLFNKYIEKLNSKVVTKTDKIICENCNTKETRKKFLKKYDSKFESYLIHSFEYRRGGKYKKYKKTNKKTNKKNTNRKNKTIKKRR